jgi:hypothetical protein
MQSESVMGLARLPGWAAFVLLRLVGLLGTFRRQ